MRFHLILTLLFLSFFFFANAGQSKIDYAHKSLKKEIEKTWNRDINDLIEIGVHAELPYQGKFFKVPGTDNKIVYVGRVNSCRVGGCSIDQDAYGPSEYFDYFIFYDEHANIELVKIFNYAATHGHEVMAKGWLKQFRGFNHQKELEVGKNIDSISGATISVHAITEDISEKTKMLISYINSSPVSTSNY